MTRQLLRHSCVAGSMTTGISTLVADEPGALGKSREEAPRAGTDPEPAQAIQHYTYIHKSHFTIILPPVSCILKFPLIMGFCNRNSVWVSVSVTCITLFTNTVL
jgi:hypothetical protein